MKTAGSVEEYFAGLRDDQRAMLEKLRRTIRATIPEATEAISYQMPAFKVGGRAVIAYAAFKDHFSLFPMSSRVIEALGEQLGPHVTGKGTIRFTRDDPLPAAMVRKIVRARLAEMAARGFDVGKG